MRAEHLFGDELQVLSLAAVEGKVSNERLQLWLNLHRVDISLFLNNFVKKDFWNLLVKADGRFIRSAQII